MAKFPRTLSLAAGRIEYLYDGRFRLDLDGTRRDLELDEVSVELDAIEAAGHPSAPELQRWLRRWTLWHEKMWSIKLASSHKEAIRALADEHEHVDGTNFYLAPLGSDVLIDTSADGWAVVLCSWTGLMGHTADLRNLCGSLVGVGRKREREIAGRIRRRALRQGAPATDWPGTEPTPRAREPRSIRDVARAWSEGRAMKAGNVHTDGLSLYSWRLRIGRTHGSEKIAIDYRQRVSRSTSMHVGIAREFSTRTQNP